MQILLIMLIVVLLAFSVLLLALAKQSPREKQTEDKEQEEYIRDYAETVRQTGGSMKKLEHWKVIAIYTQAYYRNNISQEDKLALDAKYAQKVTFLGDLKIFFKTIETVVCRKNVYTN